MRKTLIIAAAIAAIAGGPAIAAETSAQCFVAQPTDGLSGGTLAPWVVKKGFVQGEDDERVADMGICDARHHTIRIIRR